MVTTWRDEDGARCFRAGSLAGYVSDGVEVESATVQLDARRKNVVIEVRVHAKRAGTALRLEKVERQPDWGGSARLDGDLLRLECDAYDDTPFSGGPFQGEGFARAYLACPPLALQHVELRYRLSGEKADASRRIEAPAEPAPPPPEATFELAGEADAAGPAAHEPVPAPGAGIVAAAPAPAFAAPGTTARPEGTAATGAPAAALDPLAAAAAARARLREVEVTLTPLHGGGGVPPEETLRMRIIRGGLAHGAVVELVTADGRPVRDKPGGGFALVPSEDVDAGRETYVLERLDGMGPVFSGDRIALRSTTRQAREAYAIRIVRA